MEAPEGRGMTISLPDGKQVVVNSDMGSIRLQVCAYRGSLGIGLTIAQAIKVRAALMGAILEAEKSSEQKS
jgi:hypothetical protein